MIKKRFVLSVCILMHICCLLAFQEFNLPRIDLKNIVVQSKARHPKRLQLQNSWILDRHEVKRTSLFSSTQDPGLKVEGTNNQEGGVQNVPTQQGKRPRVGGNRGGGIVEKIMITIVSFRTFIVRLMSALSNKANESLFGRATKANSSPNKKAKKAMKIGVLGIALLSIVTAKLLGPLPSKQRPTYAEVGMSDFISLSSKGKIKEVRIRPTGTLLYKMKESDLKPGDDIEASDKDEDVVCVTLPVRADPRLLDHLDKNKIDYSAMNDKNKFLARVMFQIFPLLWITGIMMVQMRALKGGGKTVGKRADEGTDIDRSLSFDDVQGIDDAKMEIQEMVNILKNPGPYIRAGVRLPSGVVMVGPPGTGKTLLARVMAAEAKVPFFYCSGSDFVEMFVGRGAARVRSLFQRASKSAPCIIFFDEIDALGRQRSASIMTSNNEAEQTLNQLLACMDGLDTNNNGVIVVAATNRYEVLDEALTRPGRFDRVVRVSLPDRIGRRAILEVHSKRLNLDEDVDLMRIAELTPGLNGAELAGICNEAGIRAVRRNSVEVTPADFTKSINDYFSSRGRSITVQRIFSDGLKIV